MFNIHRILCPVDLSDASRHALDHACALAGWYSATVTVLHVHTPVYLPVPGPAITAVAGNTALSEPDVDRLRAQVHAFVADAGRGDYPYDLVIDSGSPSNRILQYASTMPADLVVLGTHGLSGFEHMMVGSVTEKVLRKSTCPVLTVPPRAHATSQLPFKRLLCPVDFSDASVLASKTALTLAAESEAKLVFMHVLEGPEDDEARGSRSFSVPEYRRLREQKAGAELAALVPADAGRWCEPAGRIAHGKPYREILRLAEEESIDLIVMGVHGRNPIDLALFGSTTNHVVRRARCPVLTVRSPVQGRRDRVRSEAPERISLSA
jgi:nucleotide-binding universal stress UspA family protein